MTTREPLAASWRRRPGYLDTATYGLPPRQTVELSHRVIDDWQDGSVVWRTWNDAAAEARDLFASFTGVTSDSVAVGSTTSAFVGTIASSLRDDAEVVVPDCEFTSLLFPFLVQTGRGVTVRVVPLDGLADAITTSTTVVAWSAAQSSNGRIADVDAVLEAAGRVGALTVVDTTQATGWLPLPFSRFDAAVCSAYKWLCCPRGTAFMMTSPRLLAQCRPHGASWFSAEDMHSGYYGAPLRLAATARRLDVSPAWFAWMGAVSSLIALSAVGMEEVREHDVRLADELRAALDGEPAGSAIVSVAGDGLEAALAGQGIKAATRAGGCRLSFHLYNDDEDVATAAALLRDSGAHVAVS